MEITLMREQESHARSIEIYTSSFVFVVFGERASRYNSSKRRGDSTPQHTFVFCIYVIHG